MKQYTATANDDGVRLSRFVQSVTRDFPTSLLYKSFRNKRVKVNGKKAAPEYRLQAGDLIELYINDEFFPPEGAKPSSLAVAVNCFIKLSSLFLSESCFYSNTGGAGSQRAFRCKIRVIFAERLCLRCKMGTIRREHRKKEYRHGRE